MGHEDLKWQSPCCSLSRHDGGRMQTDTAGCPADHSTSQPAHDTQDEDALCIRQQGPIERQLAQHETSSSRRVVIFKVQQPNLRGTSYTTNLREP